MTRELTLAELANLAAEDEDQTEVVTGGEFNNDPPAAGLTVGRLIEYIELGKRKQPDFQGKKKADADEVRLTFELTHPDRMREYEVDGVKKTTGELLRVKIKKSLSDKAKFKKLFNKMLYGRTDKKHIAQMLNEAFLITVFHNKSKDGKKVYANIWDENGEIGIAPPFTVDAITKQKKTYAIPEATQPIRLFLWNNPTKPTWDSLFIDGTREVEDKETQQKTTVSKNWLQEDIMSATNFKGSPLDTMLNGVSESELPLSEAEVTKASAGSVVASDKAGSANTETANAGNANLATSTTTSPSEEDITDLPTDEAAPKTTKTADAVDAMAALGLLPS